MDFKRGRIRIMMNRDICMQNGVIRPYLRQIVCKEAVYTNSRAKRKLPKGI